MKQKDIALIIIIVFVSGVISFFLANKFLSPTTKKLQAAKVEEITSEFPQPSNKYFNDKSINPTRTITIGDGTPNPSPVKPSGN